MQCPRCQHENPSGVKFCGECGARLELLCPSCRASNPSANRFCNECGGALHSGTAAAQFTSPQVTLRNISRKKSSPLRARSKESASR